MIGKLKFAIILLIVVLGSLEGRAEPASKSKLVTPFRSVTCASLMIMLGKAAQFAQSDSNYTRIAINSMMGFRWNELQPKNNEDTNSYNLVTDSSGSTDKDKEKMSNQILRFEKIYRETFLEGRESPDSSVVVSGLHLKGSEVVEFFNDHKAINERLQSMSWQARRDFYKAWFTKGTKFIFTQRAPLIAVPHILKMTSLSHDPLIKLAASLVGTYGFAQTIMWALAPGLIVPVAWAGAVDYKFKQRFDSIQSMINNPKEGS